MTSEIQEKCNNLSKIVSESKRVVFFGGAGVSTESGIPDFRSDNGLYKSKFKYPAEVILSHSFFLSHTAEFYDFYREKMLFPNARPNAVHLTLADWEKRGFLKAVVTQNIDGLHSAAGSKTVYELHGSVLRNTCERCSKKFGLDTILSSNGIPQCDCGGIIKPDVVLYEEPLDELTIRGAVEAIASADTLIVGGTSLTVYPAAGFLDYFRGNNLILINKQATPKDDIATLVINGGLGEVFKGLKINK